MNPKECPRSPPREEVINGDSRSPRNQWEKRKSWQNAVPTSLFPWNIVLCVFNRQLSGGKQHEREPACKYDDW